MSLTKRYLESLPASERDAILGPVNPDEWTDDAENEPAELWGCGGCGAKWPLSHLRERGCPDCHADREWARALMEEEDDNQKEKAMIRAYSELNERQKEQAANTFIRWVGASPEDYAYEIALDGNLLSRTLETKINIFGQLKDGSLRLLLQDIPVKANEARAEGTRIALSMRSDLSVVEAWWDFAANGYTPKERGVDRFTERDESPLVKPQPKGTKAGCFDV